MCSARGPRAALSREYGNPFSQNTYTVIAIDEAGNESAPATIVVDNV
jgi:hypothetical protein